MTKALDSVPIYIGGEWQEINSVATTPVFNPSTGEIIAETRSTADAMVVADLDASLLETSSGRRWLRARRPELYDSLTKRTGIEQDTRRVRFGE